MSMAVLCEGKWVRNRNARDSAILTMADRQLQKLLRFRDRLRVAEFTGIVEGALKK